MRKRNYKRSLFRNSKTALARAKYVHQGVRVNRRSRGISSWADEAFCPSETWYEPTGKRGPGFRIVVQQPGPDYQHAVTAQQIRQRLAQLPQWMLTDLDVVQLSSMTRKKETAPCYGMQWGTAVYLYPIETTLVEEYSDPPKPILYNEARMYGGRWKQLDSGDWQLVWTKETARDFYLNNVLIHELGHLLDDRNSTYLGRERYAEWFAVEYGYKASDPKTLARRAARRKVRRRHHSK